jgi:hypothetical protein
MPHFVCQQNDFEPLGSMRILAKTAFAPQALSRAIVPAHADHFPTHGFATHDQSV